MISVIFLFKECKKLNLFKIEFMLKALLRTYSIVFFVLICACKNYKKIEDKTSDSSSKLEEPLMVNILEHPLIFEDIDLKIVDFIAIEKEDSSIDIKIIVESSKNSLYTNDHFFYIHAYPYDRVEENEFINLDTNDGELNNNQIVYRANYKGDIFDFEIVRFGLVSRAEKQRYFTRSLKNRYIKN